jgi:hypothetical protein
VPDCITTFLWTDNLILGLTKRQGSVGGFCTSARASARWGSVRGPFPSCRSPLPARDVMPRARGVGLPRVPGSRWRSPWPPGARAGFLGPEVLKPPAACSCGVGRAARGAQVATSPMVLRGHGRPPRVTCGFLGPQVLSRRGHGSCGWLPCRADVVAGWLGSPRLARRVGSACPDLDRESRTEPVGLPPPAVAPHARINHRDIRPGHRPTSDAQ